MRACAALIVVGLMIALPVGAADPIPEWAFQPLSRVKPPSALDSEPLATPVDAFIVDQLQAANLRMSPQADRITLIRRLSLDLLGLPPAPAEVDEFIADASPDAYERLVDRLLASPHFGERWGRHWLDAVGYADTVGFDVDATLIIQSEGKWRYRDWVINALNADKPYDRFVTEQLAGDELVPWRTAEHYTPEIVDSLVATGFLRTARDYTHEPESTIPLNFYEILHDTVEIVSASLLGITMNCARCHDHKFDPLTQQDYYGLMACFTPSYNPDSWRVVAPYKDRSDDRTLPDVAPSDKADIDAHNARIDEQIAAAKNRIATARTASRNRLLDERLASVPEQIRADVRAAFDTPADQRNEVQRYLAERFQDLSNLSDEQIAADLTADELATIHEAERTVAAAELQRRQYGKIQALFEVGPPPVTRLLSGGDYLQPAEEIAPAVVQVLSPGAGAAALQPASVESSSGRRLALARWLTQPDTPASALLGRVMVNRVWQHLFGEGLVATTENFGAQGATPTHPELLDWLSGRFIADGWQVKSLVRLLATSHVYRQSSTGAPDAPALAVDPQNRLLWKMRLRRLESEAIRDCIHSACGTLADEMGGPPVLIRARADGAVEIDPDHLARPNDATRRGVYVLTRRAYNESLLTVFDQPLISTTCQRRDASAVPLQSLTMLNSDQLLEQSRRLADRVADTAGPQLESQTKTAFQLVLVRPPDSSETAISRLHLDEQSARFRAAGQDESTAARSALVQLCHTLLNTSEFLYAP